ncbi:FG-GAP repeat domain-containing protein [Streptomyces sp. NPDC059491]|uniref:FG-GAP repeat domain-containing protein n=1 Tax=Streptomyces sp. NPDC059491 TaxID=3346850 RepID=UPI0036CE1689
MPSTAASRRRLAAAVTVTLAVTLAAGTVGAPAFAAPAAVAPPSGAAQATSAALTFPRRAEIAFSGTTGFLSSDGLWTGYDGVTAQRGFSHDWQATGAPDLMATDGAFESRIFDVARGTTVLHINSQIQGPIGTFVGAAGTSLFTYTQTRAFLMHTRSGATTTSRAVTGVPAGASDVSVQAGNASYGVVTYSATVDGTPKRYRGLVDLAAGGVVETYEVPADISGNAAVSDEVVAWSEGGDVVVITRATGARKRIAANRTGTPSHVGLMGDWVTYTTASAIDHGNAIAHHLTDGRTLRFLYEATSVVSDPSGFQLLRGTDQGVEGLYRLALGTDGTPAVTLVAPLAPIPPLRLLGHTVPAVADLDRPGDHTIAWKFSANFDGWAEVRHVKTGMSRMVFAGLDGLMPAEIDLQDPRRDALPNGDYTWTVDVTGEGGYVLKKSGTFRITRKTKPHDFDDNGSADLLARDASGTLWSRQGLGGPLKVGTGWGVYDRIEAAGNLGGSAVGDVVARDRTGVLWLHKGTGDGRLANRIRVGTGWNTYGLLAGGSDVTGDGRPDLLGVNAAGVLWVHQGTGRDTAPFAATRSSAGTGWGVYNEIAAVGNVAGAAAGDLVARDRAGVLWLHLGKGDGTFAPRVRIGSGWNEYTQLVAVGDADRDGRNDLVAHSPVGGQVYLYSGTGRWQAPFKGRVSTAYRAEGATYDHWS